MYSFNVDAQKPQDSVLNYIKVCFLLQGKLQLIFFVFLVSNK